jgi:hypothetical protein
MRRLLASLTFRWASSSDSDKKNKPEFVTDGRPTLSRRGRSAADSPARDLLRGYGSPRGILKELIQNAEDAGAKKDGRAPCS